MSEETKKADSAKSTEEPKAKDAAKSSKAREFETPSLQDLFKSGAHFGHETKRWNPKMGRYIHTVKGDVHVIDLTKTLDKLAEALSFLVNVADKGPIVMVGTKRQASEIVRNYAIDAGVHFVDQRWAGGLLTNYEMSKKSFRQLKDLESQFEEGVEGRTKYEISVMKKQWGKFNRLYSGMKTLAEKPKAVIVVDAKYEKNAVREANIMGIPVVAIVDTNTNPDRIDYVIPANDDAISSIELFISTFAKAIKSYNKDFRINHNLKDYSVAEVKISKTISAEDVEAGELVSTETTPTEANEPKTVKVASTTSRKSSSQSKGILGKVQKEKEEKKEKKAKTSKSKK
jgi:small subunit ribosomal protein S2